MKILIAEDDWASRNLVQHALRKENHELVVTHDGREAWEAVQADDAPRLLILDWMMPEMDGLDLCRQIRENPELGHRYIIFLTSKSDVDEMIKAFDCGADDFLAKPFDQQELLARVRVGERILNLQRSLAQRVDELEGALSQVKRLQGLIPICSYCHKVRNDEDYWQRVEGYITERSEATFSHAICPECQEKIVKPQIEELRREQLERNAMKDSQSPRGKRQDVPGK
ncbi:Response regulator MprA [Planctomycetes bacterium Pan216]|uniref:Response regulator MprA n=1 Tax=Kolteria novifilia TaxID=2527975 RepID=A0A518BAQ7_9BACT|nr:Response regulator MprA [Planctomycetes bacterium Pan216]